MQKIIDFNGRPWMIHKTRLVELSAGKSWRWIKLADLNDSKAEYYYTDDKVQPLGYVADVRLSKEQVRIGCRRFDDKNAAVLYKAVRAARRKKRAA